MTVGDIHFLEKGGPKHRRVTVTLRCFGPPLLEVVVAITEANSADTVSATSKITVSQMMYKKTIHEYMCDHLRALYNRQRHGDTET